MTDTKELLQRIAALRTRLDTGMEASMPNGSALAEKVERGAVINAMIDDTLRFAARGDASEPTPTPVHMTARGSRMLMKGRELLHALREVADDATFQRLEAGDPVARLHQDGMAMIEVLLRTAQSFPPAVSVQLRMCDGLDVVLGEVEKRIAQLNGSLTQRRHELERIDHLADCLRTLANEQPVALSALTGLADALLEEAKSGMPLRFLHASPADPARFAAAHGLTTARVLARLLVHDGEWAPQIQQALLAALVHDVGMVRVPADVLLKDGVVNLDERRLIEKHASVAQTMLLKLWPGGGWTVEAGTQHHERVDGTGYPLGRQGLQLAPFVKLLAVCDVYAALCSPRPHRPAFDTRRALTETLTLAETGCLDQAAAERLLLLSFYPVGAAVELNDGAIGLVIATHAGPTAITHPDRPIVMLLNDARGQPFAWPLIVDLLQDGRRSIVRPLNAAERHTALRRHHPHLQ